VAASTDRNLPTAVPAHPLTERRRTSRLDPMRGSGGSRGGLGAVCSALAFAALAIPAAASGDLIYTAPDDQSSGFFCSESQPCSLQGCVSSAPGVPAVSAGGANTAMRHSGPVQPLPPGSGHGLSHTHLPSASFPCPLQSGSSATEAAASAGGAPRAASGSATGAGVFSSMPGSVDHMAAQQEHAGGRAALRELYPDAPTTASRIKAFSMVISGESNHRWADAPALLNCPI